MKRTLYRFGLAGNLLSAALLVGCASGGGGSASLPVLGQAGSGSSVVASEATRENIAHVGFLNDYARLRPLADGSGVLCWRDESVDWRRYQSVMLERIQVYLAQTSPPSSVDPSDLKVLLDYFHQALVRDLAPTPIVRAAGPGVVRVRFALTSLKPTNAVASLAGTAIPYGFVAEMGSGAVAGRPAGSTPYLGQTGMEAQFRDGASGALIAECADLEIGRKYAADLNAGAAGAAEAWANGYLESFTTWNYAQDALDKWAKLFATRYAELRATNR